MRFDAVGPKVFINKNLPDVGEDNKQRLVSMLNSLSSLLPRDAVPTNPKLDDDWILLLREDKHNVPLTLERTRVKTEHYTKAQISVGTRRLVDIEAQLMSAQQRLSLATLSAPERDPVHRVLAEGLTEFPDYAAEFSMMVESIAVKWDTFFAGVLKEIPLTFNQWTRHIIISYGDRVGESMWKNLPVSPTVAMEALSKTEMQFIDAQATAETILRGDLTPISMFLGGWVSVIDLWAYLNQLANAVIPYNVFLAILKPMILKDIEAIIAPPSEDPEEMKASPLIAVRLPWIYPCQVKPGRAGMEVHPALAGKFLGVGVYISKKHMCAHLYDGPKPHLEGGTWDHRRPNPVINGALRTADDRPDGLPRYPKGLGPNVKEETHLEILLQGPALLRCYETRGRENVSIRVHPSGVTTLPMDVTWNDTDEIKLCLDENAAAKNSNRTVEVVFYRSESNYKATNDGNAWHVDPTLNWPEETPWTKPDWWINGTTVCKCWHPWHTGSGDASIVQMTIFLAEGSST